MPKFIIHLAITLFCLLIIQHVYCLPQNRDTAILVNNTIVDIHYPITKNIGTILILPGWNFPQNDICEKSEFCKLAANEGYTTVMPNMLKSIYASCYYPETRKDWLQYHTLPWLIDTLIPYLQNQFGLLKKGEKNFVLGLSTGGRGVAMLSIYSDSIFKAGAALSGDYNQVLQPNDNLMKGVYGDYEKFKDRWTGTDNPFLNASKVKFPIYLAHGKSDKIVPCEQTVNFYNELLKFNYIKNHKISINPTEGHRYEFWQSEFPAVFKFFDSFNN